MEKLLKKTKFVTRGLPVKSYHDILNGNESNSADNKIRADLGGTSKNKFEANLNRGFEKNKARFENKQKEMMELEWSNRLAASERTEAQLYPCLNVASADSTKEQRRRRKSIYD